MIWNGSEDLEEDLGLHGSQETDVVLGQALKQDVVGLRELGIVQQIRLRDWEEQLDVDVESVVQGVVAVEPEHPEVDVRPWQGSLQHGEADADTL